MAKTSVPKSEPQSITVPLSEVSITWKRRDPFTLPADQETVTLAGAALYRVLLYIGHGNVEYKFSREAAGLIGMDLLNLSKVFFTLREQGYVEQDATQLFDFFHDVTQDLGRLLEALTEEVDRDLLNVEEASVTVQVRS